jgi:hypothetical protein
VIIKNILKQISLTNNTEQKVSLQTQVNNYNITAIDLQKDVTLSKNIILYLHKVYDIEILIQKQLTIVKNLESGVILSTGSTNKTNIKLLYLELVKLITYIEIRINIYITIDVIYQIRSLLIQKTILNLNSYNQTSQLSLLSPPKLSVSSL